MLRGSFPIEVGVCRWTSANDVIEGWSTLIKPVPEWNENGSWSIASEEVHHIPRAALDRGGAPAEAMTALNAIVGSQTAFCDGGAYDGYWLTTLARAAGVVPSFKLADFDALIGRLDQRGYTRMLRFLDRAPPRHRARDDAERLMKALARGMGANHGTSRNIVAG